MLFSRKKSGNVLMMRAPRQHVQRKNTHIRHYHVWVDCMNTIPQEKKNHLRNAKSRYPQKRTERAPFGKVDKEYDKEQECKSDKYPPRAFASQPKPKQPERGGDSLSPFKFHRHGENMPHDNEESAKVSREIGYGKIRTGKLIMPI